MSLSIKQFLLHLAESNLLSRETERALIEQGDPHKRYKSTEDLARALVKSGVLTAYQAQMVYQGKGDRLTLGNYVLLDKIGSGGMGTVFRAMHRRMERIVALKELPRKLMQDEISVQRFRREVKAAARLSHPNIVTAHDADETKGVHYLVMELVEGQDLSTYVKLHGPLAVEKAVHCVLQAAKGLEYAHSQNVVHRDIKPANLLLDQSGTIKILDMGLARFESDALSEESAELTATGTVVGTVDYMSPEQALNTTRVDSRSDIYSLGITLFYLLTGHPAYLGKTAMERLVAHRENPIPSLCGERSDVPASLQAVFEQMVAKKPDDRYQSMKEVVAALEQSQQTPAVAPVMNQVISEDAKLNEFLAGLARESNMQAVSEEEFNFGLNNPDQTVAQQTQMLSDPELTTDPNTISVSVMHPHKRRRQAVLTWIQDYKIVTGIAGGVLVVLLLIALFLGGKNNESNQDQANANPNDHAALDTSNTPIQDGPPSSELPDEIGSNNSGADDTGVSYALSFNGSNSYVEVPGLDLDSIPLDQPLTIELTVKPDGTKGAANLISWLGDNWLAIFQNLDGTTNSNGEDTNRWGMGRLIDGESHLVRARAELPLGEWVKIAVVLDGRQFQLYLNGRRQQLEDYDHTLYPTEGGLFIGGAPREKLTGHNDDRWFNGAIDELRISRGSLYQKDYSPPEKLTAESNTIALYMFDELPQQQDQVIDSSSFHRNGTIHGATRQPVDNDPEPRRRGLRIFRERPTSGLIFDGVDDYVDLALLRFDPSQPISIEARIEPVSGSGATTLIAFFQAGILKLTRASDSSWEVTVGENSLSCRSWSANDAPELLNGVVCLTVDELVPKLFLDGRNVPLVRNSKVTRMSPALVFRRPTLLGGYPSRTGLAEAFHGRFLELKISSDVQHSDDYTPQTPFPDDFSTLAHYRFDQATGLSLRDSSGQLHGRIHEARWNYVER